MLVCPSCALYLLLLLLDLCGYHCAVCGGVGLSCTSDDHKRGGTAERAGRQRQGCKGLRAFRLRTRT